MAKSIFIAKSIPYTPLEGAPLLFGAADLSTTNQPRFLYPGYSQTLALVTPGMSMLAPLSGFLRNLHVRHNTTGAGGGQVTYTVRIEAVNSLLAVTMNVTAQNGQDLVHKIAVAQNQRIDIRVTKSGAVVNSPMNIVASLEFSA